MSDRRRFLKGLTSIPLATVLANPRLAAAVSAELQEIEVRVEDRWRNNSVSPFFLLRMVP